jgi:hypothetical protein
MAQGIKGQTLRNFYVEIPTIEVHEDSTPVSVAPLDTMTFLSQFVNSASVAKAAQVIHVHVRRASRASVP